MAERRLQKRAAVLVNLREALEIYINAGGREIIGTSLSECELSAGVRKSEKVTLRYPIMPIADGIGSRLIHVDCGQLG